MQPSKNRPSAPAIVLIVSVAVLFGSGLLLVLEIAHRASGWVIAATLVWVFFMFGFAHLAREIHLDGRLPRVGDWKNGEQLPQQVPDDDDWEASH